MNPTPPAKVICENLADGAQAIEPRGGRRPAVEADAAGIRGGDVLITMNGKPIQTDDDFRKFEKSVHIGQHVTAELLRGNERGKAEITVGEAP